MENQEEKLKSMYQQWKLGLLNGFEREEMIKTSWNILLQKEGLL